MKDESSRSNRESDRHCSGIDRAKSCQARHESSVPISLLSCRKEEARCSEVAAISKDNPQDRDRKTITSVHPKETESLKKSSKICPSAESTETLIRLGPYQQEKHPCKSDSKKKGNE